MAAARALPVLLAAAVLLAGQLPAAAAASRPRLLQEAIAGKGWAPAGEGWASQPLQAVAPTPEDASPFAAAGTLVEAPQPAGEGSGAVLVLPPGALPPAWSPPAAGQGPDAADVIAPLDGSSPIPGVAPTGPSGGGSSGGNAAPAASRVQAASPLGATQPFDLPPDVAALYADSAAARTSSRDLFGDNSSAANGGQQATDPSRQIASLISLLNPPPGYVMPNLTQQQQDAIPQLRQLRQATATVSSMRSVGNLDGQDMACSTGYLSDYFRDHFVGVPVELYKTGELCGVCVRMFCTDSICKGALVNSSMFMVTDSCKDCKGSNLLVSARGFKNLTGVDYNNNPTLKVAWSFESCAPLITGGIKMLPSENNAPSYLGINFSNSRALLRAVSINNLPLARKPYGSWEISSPGKNIPLKPPYDLLLQSTSGQQLRKRLTTLQAQDLGVNF